MLVVKGRNSISGQLENGGTGSPVSAGNAPHQPALVAIGTYLSADFMSCAPPLNYFAAETIQEPLGRRSPHPMVLVLP